MSQLHNSPPRQNRSFESFCDPSASSTSSSTPSAEGRRPHARPSQTGSKFSIFPGQGVFQLALAILLLTLPLSALPTGGKRIYGEAKLECTGKVLCVEQASHKGVLEWESFSIDAGERVHFQLPSEKAAILNRVTGSKISYLNGLLESNGRVFLVNPNGISIGPEGIFRTRGFVAAALHLTTEAFLSGEERLFSGVSSGVIQNQGLIEALEGGVLLLAREVTNEGTIRAENITLAAGQEILAIGEEGTVVRIRDGGTMTQKGFIEAVKSELSERGGDPRALAINLLGDIVCLSEASRTEAKGGGTILVGGDHRGQNPLVPHARLCIFEKGAEADVSGLDDGDGGRIIFWGDRFCSFHGMAYAQGGKRSGNGGFVEVSSGNNFSITGLANTLAPHGKTGTFLIDPPVDVTISTGATSGATIAATVTWDAGVNTATINNTALATQLGLSDVLIDTSTGTGDGSATGLVTIRAPVTWATATKLTISTPGNIVMSTLAGQSGILTNTYAAGAFDCIDLQANTAQSLAGVSSSGFRMLTGSSISTVDGNISIDATAGDDGNNQATGSGVNITVSGTSITATGEGSITLTGTNSQPAAAGTNMHGVVIAVTISTSNGDLTLNGTVRDGASQASTNLQGILIQGTGIIRTTGTGNLNMTGTIHSLVLGTGCRAAHIGNGGSAQVLCTGNGAISITGTSNNSSNTNAVQTVLFSGNVGTLVPSTVITSGTGSITVMGTSVATSSNGNATVFPSNTSIRADGTGSISITGVQASSDTGSAIQLGASQPGLTISAAAGSVTLEGDKFQIINNSNITISGTGTFNLRTNTTSRNITVDGTTLTSSTTANLPSCLFTSTSIGTGTSTISNFSQIIVGRTNQASTTTVDGLTCSFPLLVRNNTVTVSGTASTMGSNNLDVTIGLSSGTGVFNLNTNFTTASGTNTITGTGTASNNTFNGTTGVTNSWSITGSNSGSLTSGGIVYNFATVGLLVGGTGVDTFTFGDVGFVTSVNGDGGNNIVRGPNLTNNWAITSTDAGSFTTPNGTNVFTNVGTLVGGNQTDTFTFTNQVSLTGQVDGGAPPEPNRLVYTGWDPPPTIFVVSSTTGNASNLNTSVLYSLGYINIGSIVFPKGITPEYILEMQTQIDLALSQRLTLPYDLVGLPWSWGLWSRCVFDESIDCEKEFEPIQW